MAGFQYILTASDYFRKWFEAFPLKTKSAAKVGRHICSIIYRHGCPKRILSDQGREFVNEVCAFLKYYCSKYNSGIIPFCLVCIFYSFLFQLNNSLCSILGIEVKCHSCISSPSNGLDEKTNDDIKQEVCFKLSGEFCDRFVSLNYLNIPLRFQGSELCCF